jgi:tRNA(Ile)-lysidine synthase
LLTVARADTAAYCAEHGLVVVGEPPGHYQRDRVRGELLPALEAYNPAVRRVLAGTAAALAEERAALDGWAAAVLARLPRETDVLHIPLREWEGLPAAMRKRLVSAAAVALGGPAARLGRRHLTAALRRAAGQAGRGIDLGAGLRLERESTGLRLGRRVAAEGLVGCWELAVPGRVALPGVGTLRAERCAAAPARLASTPTTECWLDAAAVPGPLTVRGRRAGDRFQPLGMAVEKRLQDFLVDARVPRSTRGRLPVVLAGDRIAWVAGTRIAEWARVRPDATAVVHLVFEPGVAE